MVTEGAVAAALLLSPSSKYEERECFSCWSRWYMNSAARVETEVFKMVHVHTRKCMQCFLHIQESGTCINACVWRLQ